MVNPITGNDKFIPSFMKDNSVTLRISNLVDYITDYDIKILCQDFGRIFFT